MGKPKITFQLMKHCQSLQSLSNYGLVPKHVCEDFKNEMTRAEFIQSSTVGQEDNEINESPQCLP